VEGLRSKLSSTRTRWITSIVGTLLVVAPVWLAMMLGGAAAAADDACATGLPDRGIRFWPPGIVGTCPDGTEAELFSAGEVIFETLFMLAFAVAMAAVVAALIARWVERRGDSDLE